MIPYAGFGFTHTYSTPHRQALAVNAGIINRFRLSQSIDFNLDFNGMMTENKFDAELGGKRGIDAIVGVTAGFTFRFGSGFKYAANQRQLISEAELRALRADLAALAAENASLQNQLAAKPNVVEREVIVNKGGAPRIVFFNLDSSVLSDKDKMNIEFVAEEMKSNSNLRYKLTGYADSYTGNPTYNQGLSERRANAVADELVSKGVDRSRLDISGEGGVALYQKPYLNRQVLIEPK
ncbi:MAG: OmpA family protein [Bacteroides sp.]|nr:OmpA family protein [Bacteroides sp.]